MEQDPLHEKTLRIMDSYADQMLTVEALTIECDTATGDCSPELSRQLQEAQRRMCELREILSDLIKRLGYVPRRQCGRRCEQ